MNKCEYYRIYAMDWDDNIIKMPTKIVLIHKETQKEKHISTKDYAKERSNIGKSGKFDAILSLYHDQGHIACKTLDFEKSVTLTFGLPFIRSSVDHGTAFDIADKGIAGCISMIESTKVVAEYAAKQHEKKEA